MGMKEALLIFLRGVFMGMADIIPGVSGGTIALITGIYERFIFALRNINSKPFTLFIKGDLKGSRKEFLRIDWAFLIPLGIGIGSSFMVMSNVIKFFMEVYPANTYAFFFGLILASAGFVYKHVSGLNSRTISVAVIGFLFAFLFVDMGTLQSSHSIPVIFFSGMVAICAMILPGISGAFILFFLGQYEYMLTALHSVDLPIITVFMTGALIGLFGMARILGYLLKEHKAVTMSFLVGLMLGALRLPYNNVIANAFEPALVIISGTVGFFSVVVLERASCRFEKKQS